MSFKIKLRGAASRFTTADYLCPTHGRVELLVDREPNGDTPDHVTCPEEVEGGLCSELAAWVPSAPPVHTQFVVSASQGKSDPKPHRYSMDTRMVAEGRKNEFRKQRRQIREELRHQRVKELLS